MEFQYIKQLKYETPWVENCKMKAVKDKSNLYDSIHINSGWKRQNYSCRKICNHLSLWIKGGQVSKMHEETFYSIRNIVYLDYGTITVCNYQNSSNCTCKWISLYVIMLQ